MLKIGYLLTLPIIKKQHTDKLSCAYNKYESQFLLFYSSL